MKKIIFILFGIGIGIGFSCNTSQQNQTISDTATIDTTKSEKEKSFIPDKKENWHYDIDSSDKMEKSIIKLALCESLNKIDLNAPYDGGILGYINIRNGWHHKGNEAFITVDKGQFMPSLEGESSIKVKFDENKPMSFNYNEASSGSSGIIFIENAGRFLESLKKSKRVIIEAEFFDNGYKQLEFNSAGLIWKN